MLAIQQDQPTETFQLQPRNEGAFAFKPMTIFSMSQDQIERLKLLSQMYSVSTAFSGASKDLKSQGDYFLLMLKGLEIGVPPMTAVDYIDIIYGKPVLNGKGMLAIVQGSPACEDVIVDDKYEDKVIVTMRRKGRSEPYQVEFGKKEADAFMTTEWVNGSKKSIPLSEKSNYKSQAKVMWRWRAITACARLAFPDVIGGMYLSEELDSNIAYSEEGEVVSGTVTQLEEPKQSKQSPPPPNVTPLQQPEEPEQDTELVPTGNDEQGSSSGKKEEPVSWLQQPDEKKWLIDTMTNNNLDVKTFFTKIDPKATGWNDIAKTYPDRKALEKAISDAMVAPSAATPQAEEAYTNAFDLSGLFPDKWDEEGEALTMIESFVEQYFDETADDLIAGGMGCDEPTKEYRTPLELWNAIVDFAIETNVNLLCNQFCYKTYGKVSRIETNHPVLAVIFSRQEFIKLIGEPKVTDHYKIADWKASDEEIHFFDQAFVIAYETKTNKEGRAYRTITSVSIKPTPVPDNLDDFFAEV